MKKRLLVAMLACAMAVSCMAACSGRGNDGPVIQPDDPITEQVTIDFWGWGDLSEQENYQTLVNQFMAEEGNENITVIYRGISSSTYMTTLRASARNLPELFYMPDYDFLEWVSSGLLKDISGYVTDDELSQLWPQAVDEYYYNPDTATLGQSERASLYGLPKDLGPFTLVYNKALLDRKISEKGLDSEEIYATYLNPESPMTWEQFRTLLKQLVTDENGDGTPDDSVYGISHYEIETAVYSNDANFFTDHASEQRITDPDFINALQFIADLTLVDHVMVPAALQSETDGFTRFLNSGCIFSFMGPWDCAQFWSFNIPFESNILPVPYNGANPDAMSTAWVGSMGYCVSNNASSLQTAAAMRLAKYLCMDEAAQRKFYQLGQQVPNIVSMATDEYVNDTQGLLEGKDPADRSVWVDTIDGFSDTDKIGGKVRPRYYTYSSGWYDDFLTYIDEQGLWTGVRTAEQICTAYAQTFQGVLDEMIANLG